MKNQLLICALAATLFACSEGSDLKKSIFVPDADDSRLPAYTEWGYNTFGAYTDGRDVFTFSNSDIPLKIYASSSATELEFSGEMYEEYGANNSQRELIIMTTAIAPKSAEDLAALNGKTIKLDASNSEVYVVKNGVKSKIVLTTGSYITFNRVQKIYIDKKYTQMIVSGYFEIFTASARSSDSFTDGRFDVGIKDGYSFFNE